MQDEEKKQYKPSIIVCAQLSMHSVAQQEKSTQQWIA